jgi:hypothetical protein
MALELLYSGPSSSEQTSPAASASASPPLLFLCLDDVCTLFPDVVDDGMSSLPALLGWSSSSSRSMLSLRRFEGIVSREEKRGRSSGDRVVTLAGWWIGQPLFLSYETRDRI